MEIELAYTLHRPESDSYFHGVEMWQPLFAPGNDEEWEQHLQDVIEDEYPGWVLVSWMVTEEKGEEMSEFEQESRDRIDGAIELIKGCMLNHDGGLSGLEWCHVFHTIQVALTDVELERRYEQEQDE